MDEGPACLEHWLHKNLSHEWNPTPRTIRLMKDLGASSIQNVINATLHLSNCCYFCFPSIESDEVNMKTVIDNDTRQLLS